MCSLVVLGVGVVTRVELGVSDGMVVTRIVVGSRVVLSVSLTVVVAALVGPVFTVQL